MRDVVVHGFQRGAYVNHVRLAPRCKGIDFRFNDLEAVPAFQAAKPAPVPIDRGTE